MEDIIVFNTLFLFSVGFFLGILLIILAIVLKKYLPPWGIITLIFLGGLISVICAMLFLSCSIVVV